MKKKCRWTWAGRLGWIFGFCGAIWLWAAWLLPTAVSPATVAVSGSRVTEGNYQQKIVRVAYYQEPDWQEGAGEGNVKRGCCYEYYQRLAPYANWRYEYVYGSFPELYKMFLQGEIDVFAGLSWTEERTGQFLYPELPMGQAQYIFLKRSGDSSITEDPASFNGKRLGTVAGIVESSLREFVKQQHLRTEVLAYGNTGAAIAALQEGTVDAVLGETSIGVIANTGLESFVSGGTKDFYLCVTAGREDLLQDLNYAQESLHQVMPALTKQLAASRSIYPEAEILFYDTIEGCLDAVKYGGAGGTLLNGMRTYPLLRQGRYKMLNVSPTSEIAMLGFGVAGGSAELLNLLNRGVSLLPDDYVMVNIRTYEQDMYEYTLADFFAEYQFLVIFLLSLIAVLAVAVAVMYVRAARTEKKAHYVLQRALEQAEEGSRAKTNFLFNMSHDIRTPMNAILGFTELLKKNKDKPELVNDYVAKIQSSGDFLLSLINNVLEMARIESGQETLSEEVINVHELVKNVRAVFEASLRAKNLILQTKVLVEHPDAYVDTTKVRQIFLNLLSNAVKYTPSGGKIWLEIREQHSDWQGYGRFQIEVRDTGIGMSEEFLPHIFDEFSRARNTTESKIIGTGLGMPIVKKLVDLMGGSIQVESQAGRGTTFRIVVYFRLAEQQNSEQEENAAGQLADLRDRHILLAEDNDLNAEIAIAILTEMGCQVDRACDGLECVDMLAKAASDYYDLVLMDVQMPNMNGLQATGAIRSMTDEAKAKIPIVAMTANVFEEDRKKCLEAGMNDHLGKPIDVAIMLQVIARYVK